MVSVKTTMFLQYIKEHQSEQNMLYVSADYVYFSFHTLVDLADEFCREGGEYLLLMRFTSTQVGHKN